MRVNNFVPSQEVFQQGIGKFNNINKIDESKENNTTFKDTLKGALNNLNDTQINADNLTQSFIKGDDVEISDVMLASEEAKLSLQFAVQVRNKIVDAYKELSQMQL